MFCCVWVAHFGCMVLCSYRRLFTLSLLSLRPFSVIRVYSRRHASLISLRPFSVIRVYSRRHASQDCFFKNILVNRNGTNNTKTMLDGELSICEGTRRRTSPSRRSCLLEVNFVQQTAVHNSPVNKTGKSFAVLQLSDSSEI